MLISLEELVQKYGIQFRGVLHVGAHECEELRDYEKYVRRDQVLWIEALPAKVAMSQQRYPGLLIEHAVVSDVEEEVDFHVSNNGQSSSLLEFGLHEKFHPQVTFIGSVRVRTQLLGNILRRHETMDCNFLNLDIQGAELRALRGMEQYLPKVDYVYTEVNSDFVYKGCALVKDLDEYLGRFGLYRVETVWTECDWGDAFYVRASRLQS